MRSYGRKNKKKKAEGKMEVKYISCCIGVISSVHKLNTLPVQLMYAHTDALNEKQMQNRQNVYSFF